MSDTARAIKDLSIAMEALSRVPGERSNDLRERVSDLLDNTLHEEERRLHNEAIARHKQSEVDDEIPF